MFRCFLYSNVFQNEILFQQKEWTASIQDHYYRSFLICSLNVSIEV